MRFSTEEEAAAALDEHQGDEIEGRAIRLTLQCEQPKQRAEKPAAATPSGDGQKSSTLFIGNLSFNADEDSMREKFPNAVQVRLPTHYDTGKPKGIAFVKFETSEEAEAAMEEHQGAEIDGRSIKIDMANDKPPGERRSFGGNKSFGGGDGGKSESRFSECVDNSLLD